MYFGQQKSCATAIFLTMIITLTVICGFCSVLLGIILFIDSGYSGCDYDKTIDNLSETSKSACKDEDEKEQCITLTGVTDEATPVTIEKVCRYRPSFIDIIAGEFSDD